MLGKVKSDYDFNLLIKKNLSVSEIVEKSNKRLVSHIINLVKNS